MNKKTIIAFAVCMLVMAGSIKAGADFWYLNGGYLKTVIGFGIQVPKISIVGSNNATSTAALSIINASSTVGLHINNDAKVGIGTTVPAYKFDVNGTLHATGDSSFDGKVGIGTTAPAMPFDITSTTGGILIPRMTSTQRDAVATTTEGVIIYNMTTHLINFWNGSEWQTATSTTAL